MKRRDADGAAIVGRWQCSARRLAAQNPFDYCLLCHGANANGNYGIRAPKISGMETWYLTRQLENFAAGIRGVPADDAAGHEMRTVGMRLMQENVLPAAVQFIASLESKKPAPTVRATWPRQAALPGLRRMPWRQGRGQRHAPGAGTGRAFGLVPGDAVANYQRGLRGADPRDPGRTDARHQRDAAGRSGHHRRRRLHQHTLGKRRSHDPTEQVSL